jgi:methylthioribulose-1-phosphate dehydratase
MQSTESLLDETLGSAVADIIGFLHDRGWTPATSSNFSYRNSGTPNYFYVSMSGLDKSEFNERNFLEVDFSGRLLDPEQSSARPSAETLLHAMLYERYPGTHVILHTHSANATVLSKLYEAKGGILLKDFEILKGLEGIQDHETEVWLPIFSNDQDMTRLSQLVDSQLQKRPATHGFLLAGHGLYAWGASPAQAKRHVEVYEFLFDCILKLRSHGYTDYPG